MNFPTAYSAIPSFRGSSCILKSELPSLMNPASHLSQINHLNRRQKRQFDRDRRTATTIDRRDPKPLVHFASSARRNQQLLLHRSILPRFGSHRSSKRSLTSKTTSDFVRMLALLSTLMFFNELSACSEAYCSLAARYASAKELSNASTLESLLFKMIVAAADYWPEHNLP